jgi:LuxR family transcriptional regulator, maltose regulon positive regulatory protein
MANMSNRRRMPGGTEAPCLLCSVMRHRMTSSDVAVDKASATPAMPDRPLQEGGHMAICIAIKRAVIIALETVQPEASDEYSLALRFAASGDLSESIQNVGSEIGSLLADFQQSVRRHSTTAEPTTDASKAMDHGNEDHAIDKRRRKSTSDALSPREIATIGLIGQGQSNKEIARTLGIAPETVKSHVKHIFLKLEVESRAQAVSRAHALGLISGVAQTYVGHGDCRAAPSNA